MTDNQESSETPEILPGYTSIADFTKEGFKVLMEAIRNSNALPTGRDWGFYNTSSESFKNIMNAESNHVMRLMNNILHIHDVEGNIRNKLLGEKLELIIEANDVILEKVANNIDELNGIKKSVVAPVEIQTVSAHLPINGSWNRVNNAKFSVTNNISNDKQSSGGNAIRLLTGKNIIRPQKFFKDKIDNSNRPWEPRIKDKPNSLKPLAIFLEETEYGEQYSHPYEFELERFVPPQHQLEKETPVIPKPVEETPLVEITEPEQLDGLVEKLRSCEVFAVDLEHHSYRTFMGITCLMQISTADCDYLIDTLALRDKLYVLNEVFTKPTILKIFHGADSDIQWLQRDLSLYIVNMFDTHQAARVLEYPTLSLAFLMKKFCNFLPNKQFQLADWRIRPLTDEMKSYAREDTHYLVYIYQMLKKELLKKGNGSDNLLKSVFQRSTQICLKRYIKPIWKEDSHLEFYRKCKRLFDNRQLYAMKGLYKWRDNISRQEDESTGYVLPNHMLLQIAETLPREMQGILACCNPTPPLVKSNLLELHHIILKARDQPLEKAILKEDSRSRGSTIQHTKINIDSPLHCPQDLSKSSEFRDDLPTLLGKKINNEIQLHISIEKEESQYSVFSVSTTNQVSKEKLAKVNCVNVLTPYQRYKLAKKFIKHENEIAAAKEAEAAKSSATKDGENVEMGTKSADEGDSSEVTQAIPTDKERTDEERIASIREHFLQLSKRTAEESREVLLSYDDQAPATLLQMGGTKKRKREPSPENEDHLPFEPESDSLQTPRPSVFTRISPRKRTSSEAFGQEDDESYNPRKRTSSEAFNKEGLNDNFYNSRNEPKKKRNRNWKKKKQNANNNSDNAGKSNSGNQSQNLNVSNDGNVSQNQNPTKNVPNKFKKKNKRWNNKNKGNKKAEPNQEAGSSSGGGPGHGSSRQRPPGNKKGKNKQHKQQQQQQNNDRNDFKPFDYSNVDFGQFQGGAQAAHRPQQFKQHFRGKGRKRPSDRGNKSSMFSNRGRGRGR